MENENVDERLDRVRELLKDEDFLAGKGLSNEVNIRLFCYNPADEMHVRHFVKQILGDVSMPCHLRESNLYEILLSCCADKRILPLMGAQEEKRGKDRLEEMIEQAVPLEDYVEKIVTPPLAPRDVILLTGVGDVFPFMRVHRILEALQEHIEGTPVVVFYPGTFDGRNLKLFDRLEPNPYYRAFSIV